MTITTSQIFQIGTAIIGLATAIAPIWIDPHTVAIVGGAVATCWASIGAGFTGQGSQLKEVAAYPGVESIQTNKNANATVKALADDDGIPKVLPPK